MVAPAIIAAGASILGGLTGGKGASKAAKIQADAYRQGLAQQQAQYELTRADYQPYLTAGTGALSGMQGLVGLNGNDAQAAAIAALKGSPGFTSLYDTGVDTVLQNASATGGLRGGDATNSLSQFGSGLLAQVIQQQLGNLGGIAGMGANAVGGVTQAGQANTNAQTQLIGQIGNANAVRGAAPYAALSSIFQGIGANAGGLGGMFGGGAAKGGMGAGGPIVVNNAALQSSLAKAFGSGGW